MKKALYTFATLAALTIPIAGAHAQNATWVHLHVEEDSVTQMRLNLPIAMVSVVLETIRSGALNEAARSGRGSDDLQLDDARRMWQAMRDAGDAEFLDVRDGDERVRVFREGDRVFVQGNEGDTETLRIEMPVEIADALLAEEGETVDVEAAIQALARRGESELVRIQDGGATVRFWADARSTQDE